MDSETTESSRKVTVEQNVENVQGRLTIKQKEAETKSTFSTQQGMLRLKQVKSATHVKRSPGLLMRKSTKLGDVVVLRLPRAALSTIPDVLLILY